MFAVFVFVCTFIAF